jgi:hypothetical protein
MPIGPTTLQGVTVSGDGGRVEFRLARNALVRAFQRGRVGRTDLCDAHPELLRAARHIGRPTAELCPVCDESDLVHVTYVFGPRLPPNGRCPATLAELERLCRRTEPVACYVVEVCPGCGFNHLVRMFPAGGRRRAASRRPPAAAARQS